MNNKLNNMLEDFMEGIDFSNKEEANEKLQEFIVEYNKGNIEYKNTPLDDAEEILEKARNAKTENEAKKLAKKAYDTSHECFDAILFLADLENDYEKRNKMLDKGLEREKKRLEGENFFNDDCMGIFYGIFETRPYMRGLYQKLMYLIDGGKLSLAKRQCEEILRLNENDNLGARYVLMGIYAVLEDEENMLKLYKKFPEDDLEMLFPLFALYYKLEDDKKALKYLKKIDKCNSNFVKYFRNTLKEDEQEIPGCYTRGGVSEVLMYFEEYDFLTDTVPFIDEYVLEKMK